MKRVGDVLAVTGYRLGWSAVRRLPERAAYGLFERLADLTTARNGVGVQRSRGWRERTMRYILHAPLISRIIRPRVGSVRGPTPS